MCTLSIYEEKEFHRELSSLYRFGFMGLSIDLDFGFSYRVASAPGKVLMTGGYLVLERPNAGIVLSTNARFYAIVKPLNNNIDPEILVRLHDNSLRFSLSLTSVGSLHF